MSFLRAAHAALAGQSGLRRTLPAALTVMILVPAGLFLSCSSSVNRVGPSHNAYVTLPTKGSVALLHIDGATGTITMGAQTPQVLDTTPTALVLLPSKKFLYAVNSFGNSISIFNVNPDGTLGLSGTPIPAGTSPNAAVIDPSGKYLLVTNSALEGYVSVFSVDPGSGALAPVGSPVPANAYPSDIVFTHSGKFVYVTNPGEGAITAFAFCPPQLSSEPQCSTANGLLNQLPISPFPSLPGSGGAGGALGLAVDASDSFLYVANPSASNPLVLTVGNVSGFTIDPGTGALTPILGSPFTASDGSGPTAITVDPSGRFVFAVTTGSSDSIWCFTITSTNGQNGQLVAATGSPFSVAAGDVFALIDPTGNYFYIGGQTGVNGYTYDPATGSPTAIPGSPFSTGVAPGGMVLSE